MPGENEQKTDTKPLEQTAAQQPPATTAPAAKTDDWKPPSREEWERVTKSLSERNKEAAENRKAADEAKAKADAEAKAKLEAEGKWKELFESERKAKDELAGKAANADRYEAVLKAEVESLEKQLGDRAKSVAHLSLADRLPILKEFATLAAGPGRVQSTTAAPPAPAATDPNVEAMSPDERRAYYAELGRKDPARLAQIAGARGQSTPFGWRVPTSK